MYTLIMIQSPDDVTNQNGLVSVKHCNTEIDVIDEMKHQISIMCNDNIIEMCKKLSYYQPSYGFTVLYGNEVVWFDTNNHDFYLKDYSETNNKYYDIFQPICNELRKLSHTFVHNQKNTITCLINNEKQIKLARDAFSSLKELENVEIKKLKELMKKYPEIKNGDA